MKRYWLALYALLFCLVLWGLAPLPAQAQSPTYYVKWYDFTLDVTQTGCSTVIRDFGTFTAENQVKGVVWKKTTTVIVAGSTIQGYIWANGTFRLGNIDTTTQTNGTLYCTSHAINCSTLGFTWLNQGGLGFGPTSGSVNLKIHTEVNCGYDKQARLQVTQFGIIYYGVQPPAASFTADPTSGTVALTVTLDNTSVAATSYLWDFGDGTTSTSAEPETHSYNQIGTYVITLTATNSVGSSQATEQIEVLEPGAASGLTRPLRESEEHPQWGIFDYAYAHSLEDNVDSDYPYTVYAMSNTANAKVAAVTAGTVIELRPLTLNDCPGLTAAIRRCAVVIPQVITQEVSSELYVLEMVNVFQVRIQDALDDTIIYTYWLAQPKVKLGDDVSAGCHIGTTIQLKNINKIELKDISAILGLSGGLDGGGNVNASIGATGEIRSLLLDAGITLIWMQSEGVDTNLRVGLVQQPTMESCSENALGGCVTENAGFEGLDYWSYSDATANPGSGVVLHPAGTLYQDDLVVAAGNYNLTIEAQVLTAIESPVKLYAQLGQYSHEFTISDGEYQVLTWPVTFTGGTTSVLLINDPTQNSGGEFPDILIRYVCLSPIAYSVEPGTCRFANHHFDSDGTGWTTAGTVTFASGQAYLNNNEVIEQAVPFFLDQAAGANTYRLTAGVRLLASASYTAQVGKSVTLGYRYKQSGTWAALGYIDSALVTTQGLNAFDGKPNLNYPYQFSVDFAVTTESSELFSFAVWVSDADNYIQGLRIDWVCLEALEGESGVPIGGGFVPPFVEGCQVVPTPEDNNVSSWTYYHWSQLNRFFSCDLMKLLNKWFNQFDQFQKTVRYVMRYWIVFTHRGADWLTGTVYWANGHFRNIAVGQVTVVYESGGGCSDLFCVLDSLITQILSPIISTLLGLVTQAANLLFSIITTILNLVVGMIYQLLGFAQLGQGLLSTLLAAYNSATPLPIPGMPSCTVDPSNNLFCLGIWVLDNVFSGRWELILHLIVGFLSIHLLLWAIEEFKEVVVKAGTAA